MPFWATSSSEMQGSAEKSVIGLGSIMLTPRVIDTIICIQLANVASKLRRSASLVFADFINKLDILRDYSTTDIRCSKHDFFKQAIELITPPHTENSIFY